MYNENNELIYSVKVSESEKDDCTGVYRHPRYANELIENFFSHDIESLWDCIEESMKKYKNYQCLGTRVFVNNKLGDYKWKSYLEVRELALAFGSGLINNNCCTIMKIDDDVIKKGTFLGIYIPNKEEWTIADYGCLAYNIITVPLYDSLGVESNKFILNQTQMQSILCNKDCALKLFDTLDTCDRIHLKNLIIVPDIVDESKIKNEIKTKESKNEIKTKESRNEIKSKESKIENKKESKIEDEEEIKENKIENDMKENKNNEKEENSIENLDKDIIESLTIKSTDLDQNISNQSNIIDDQILQRNKKFNLNIYAWNDIIQAGKKKILNPIVGNLNTIITLCYTSGTTGKPKGVIMTNKNMLSLLNAAAESPVKMHELNFSPKDTHISYLPLAHIYERMFINLCFLYGVKIGYFSGNIKALIEDIQILKPTIFISVPRLYNRIYEKIYSSLKKKSNIVQTLFNKAIEQKLKKLKSTGSTTHMLWDRLLFNKMKKLLGGNVRIMLNGSAPLSSDVINKLKCIFCVPVIEGYAMTETAGGGFITHKNDNIVDHIGGPIPSIEFRLTSIPEMNYLVTDNPPRGELCLRGSNVCLNGYFKLKDENNTSFSKDGWICTGDVGSLNPNGSIKIIDRKKNIFKLAQGEYIAAEKIESVYQQSLYVTQIFIFGYSFESFLVSIVYSSEENMDMWKKKNKKNNLNYDDILKSDEYKKCVLEDLINIGKSLGLKGYEQIKDVYFTPEPFSIENDLLTPTGKVKRFVAYKKFKIAIDQMYEKVKAVN